MVYNSDPNLRCYECEQWCRGRAALRKHKEECHGQGEWYRCPYCTYVGRSVVAVMVSHIQHSHPGKFEKTTLISIVKVPKTSRARSRTASPKGKKQRLSCSPKPAKPEKYNWSPTPKQPKYQKREEACTRAEVKLHSPYVPTPFTPLSDDLGDGPSFEIVEPSSCLKSPPQPSRGFLAGSFVGRPLAAVALGKPVTPEPTPTSSTSGDKPKTPEPVSEKQACLEKDLELTPSPASSPVNHEVVHADNSQQLKSKDNKVGTALSPVMPEVSQPIVLPLYSDLQSPVPTNRLECPALQEATKQPTPRNNTSVTGELGLLDTLGSSECPVVPLAERDSSVTPLTISDCPAPLSQQPAEKPVETPSIEKPVKMQSRNKAVRKGKKYPKSKGSQTGSKGTESKAEASQTEGLMRLRECHNATQARGEPFHTHLKITRKLPDGTEEFLDEVTWHSVPACGYPCCRQ